MNDEKIIAQFTEREQGFIDRGAYDPDCTFCQKAGRPGGFFPPHTASVRCESGRRNHCSCSGACF